MNLFSIDPEKCTRCNACVAECPISIISMKKEDTVPVAVPAFADFCINCGHCVAVCPEEALSHKNLSPGDCLPVKEEWLLSPEQTNQFLRYRRSIRNYKKGAVARELLEKCIDIAHYAPTGHNTQTVHWAVIYNNDELQRLIGHVIDWMRYMIKEQPEIAGTLHLDLVVGAWEAGIDKVCRGAPHVILSHGHEKDRMAQNSCIIASTYLDLAAPSLGLGSCWAGYVMAAAKFWPPMKEALGLPEGHVAHSALMVGYPMFKYHRMPARNEVSIQWK